MKTPNSQALPAPAAPRLSAKQANAGLLLMGPLSSIGTVAALAADCLSLGDDAPSTADFFVAHTDLCGQVHKGNLGAVESMLMTQAMSLNLLANAMMSRATRSLGTNFDKVEAYMRLALKAQNQSRMTLETLANVKNPPVVYARQANINNGGQQQVNNGVVHGAAPAHAAESQTEQTELLEQQHGERLDTRKAREAVRADPHLATVGTVDRPYKRGRKG